MAKLGFLYTIGLLLMSLTVLSLVLIISQVEKKSNEQVSDLSRYERAYNLDSSINNAFTEVFKTASGISISHGNYTKKNQTLRIRETLPNSNSTIFFQNMTSLSWYLNKTSNLASDNVTISLNNLANIKSNLPLQIMPYNISYEHISYFGSNTIKFTPKRFNFYGYNITIITPIDPSATLQPFSIAAGDRTMAAYIKIKGPLVTRKLADTHVPPAGLSSLDVKDSGGINSLALISIDNTVLTITNPRPTNKLTVSVEVILWKNLTRITQVYYPGKLYNVTLPDFGIKTESNVMIASFPA